MTDDFDPNHDPSTQDEYNAYIRWCAVQFNRVVGDGDTPRTHRTAFRTAAWLYVVSTAQLHLDDVIEDNRETYMRNLAGSATLARRIEREDPDVGLRDLMVSRSVLDCWLPEGQFSSNLLDAAKCAVSALTLKEVHLLEDLWDVDAPDTWSLILMGAQSLAAINEHEHELSFADYSVLPNASVIDKMNWQKANKVAGLLGGPPISPN